VESLVGEPLPWKAAEYIPLPLAGAGPWDLSPPA